MALRVTLAWLCLLTVLSSSAAQHDTSPRDCYSQSMSMDKLSSDIKMAVECDIVPNNWSGEQIAAMLNYMRNLTDIMHKHQRYECSEPEPRQCPEAEVPDNGGLVCVTVADKRYCKPLCNYGYDFGFIRRSRLFEECSDQTSFKWQSQYAGGNKLAVCNEASIQVSGAKTAYFPEYQDCLTTKSNSQLRSKVIEVFNTELRNKGIVGEDGEVAYTCFLCGRP
ncbi:uncharacterized protein LOC114447427 [Parambassis ranga]|uniref:Uncharacterized protein LOC114447427 n=1 Tax=Parambassis ranga TaxID=210632 RepID=A0A6P7JR69_9TELE|nr:uncharacterized protein LOC114447427 [Parambassis ranga]